MKSENSHRIENVQWTTAQPLFLRLSTFFWMIKLSLNLLTTHTPQLKQIVISFFVYLYWLYIIGLLMAMTIASVNTFPFVANVGQNAKWNKTFFFKTRRRSSQWGGKSRVYNLVEYTYECVVQHLGLRGSGWVWGRRLNSYMADERGACIFFETPYVVEPDTPMPPFNGHDPATVSVQFIPSFRNVPPLPYFRPNFNTHPYAVVVWAVWSAVEKNCSTTARITTSDLVDAFRRIFYTRQHEKTMPRERGRRGYKTRELKKLNGVAMFPFPRRPLRLCSLLLLQPNSNATRSI